jgi:tRNA(adenine34) deaminase
MQAGPASGAHMLFSDGMSETDRAFMQIALDEAREAERAGEVPVGAVITLDGREIARGSNRTLRDCDPTAHAEIVALRAAARAAGNHRLPGSTLYATIEPCAMCAGAIVQARLARLVYGAADPKGGAVRTCFAVLNDPQLNHRMEITAGLMAEECAGLLQSFFSSRR